MWRTQYLANGPWADASHRTWVSLLPPRGLSAPLGCQTPSEKTLDERSKRTKLDPANQMKKSDNLRKSPEQLPSVLVLFMSHLRIFNLKAPVLYPILHLYKNRFPFHIGKYDYAHIGSFPFKIMVRPFLDFLCDCVMRYGLQFFKDRCAKNIVVVVVFN